MVFTAAAGGGGWETYQNEQMQDLDHQYAAGKISKEEYESRKSQIEDSSLLQR